MGTVIVSDIIVQDLIHVRYMRVPVLYYVIHIFIHTYIYMDLSHERPVLLHYHVWLILEIHQHLARWQRHRSCRSVNLIHVPVKYKDYYEENGPRLLLLDSILKVNI